MPALRIPADVRECRWECYFARAGVATGSRCRVTGRRSMVGFCHQHHVRVGRDRLIDLLEPTADARILEIGCGTARNLIKLAKHYPGRRFFGLDASEAMLETAARAIEQAGLESQISLVRGYAENLGPHTFELDTAFDDIVFSYSLSMIPDWRRALEAASAVLSPGGRIHVVDFGDLAGIPRPVRQALLAWLAHFHVEPRVQLMRELEENSDKCDIFQILKWRYAFISINKGWDPRSGDQRVASGSQGMDKTGLTTFRSVVKAVPQEDFACSKGYNEPNI